MNPNLREDRRSVRKRVCALYADPENPMTIAEIMESEELAKRTVIKLLREGGVSLRRRGPRSRYDDSPKIAS